MKFGSVPFLARVTPAAPSGGAEITASGSVGFAFGSSRNLTVPAGAEAGDRIVLVFDAANPVTGVTDNQSTSYSAPTIASKTSTDAVYVSAPLGATVPTTITISFGSGTGMDKCDIYVVRGASGTVSGDGAFSTGNSTDPRSHAYTTTAADDFVFGIINFGGGGVTGATGQDGDHTWFLNSGSGYRHGFGIVRPTAGSYGATLGPTGASSGSGGFWFRLEAA